MGKVGLRSGTESCSSRVGVLTQVLVFYRLSTPAVAFLFLEKFLHNKCKVGGRSGEGVHVCKTVYACLVYVHTVDYQ